MKFVHFWRMAVKELSLSEKIYYRDLLEKLSAWQSLMEKYPEFVLIQQILESEIPAKSKGDMSQTNNSSSAVHMKLHYSLPDELSSFIR